MCLESLVVFMQVAEKMHALQDSTSSISPVQSLTCLVSLTYTTLGTGNACMAVTSCTCADLCADLPHSLHLGTVKFHDVWQVQRRSGRRCALGKSVTSQLMLSYKGTVQQEPQGHDKHKMSASQVMLSDLRLFCPVLLHVCT